MAEKTYWIRVPEGLVEVTKEVYVTYYRVRRREQFLEEKDARNGKVLYCDLDTEEILGEEMIPDHISPDVQDAVMARLMAEKLHACLKKLPEGERKLLYALYFDGLSERQYSAKTGVPQKTVHNRKKKAIQKLKKFFEKF